MKRIVTAIALALALMAPVAAQAEEPVLCMTLNINQDNLQQSEVYQIDDGLRWAIVGHFLWVKNSPHPDSYENVVSVELLGKDSVTLCTDYVPADEIITYGVAFEPTADVTVVVSDTPEHVAVAEVWIEANYGFYIL